MTTKRPIVAQPHHVTKKTIWQLLAAFAVFAVPVVTFARLASEVREREGFKADTHILQWVHQFSSPILNDIAISITYLGDAVVIVPVTLVAVGSLFYLHRRRAATFLLFGVGGAACLNLALKLFFQRARPDLWTPLVAENTYSFPSGHAMSSSALALSVIVLLWPTRWRWWAMAAGAVYAVLVGLSRLYLGVHYPTDIVAGWCVSFVWVLIVKIIIDKIQLRKKAVH